MKFTQLFKSKTLWINLAGICTGIGMFVSGEQHLAELIVAILNTIGFINRFFTVESLGSK